MDEKEYGTFGPAVDAETFFTNPVYYEDGIDGVSPKKYSVYVDELLDCLGYSYEMIKHRQQMATECDKFWNRTAENSAFTRVTTGGKSEGTTLLFESDTDFMLTGKDVICADNTHRFIHQENITLLQTETQETSPGYTRLKMLRFDGESYNAAIGASLFEADTGSYYLSSQFFTDAMRKSGMHAFTLDEVTCEPISGPSTPSSYKYQSWDHVFGFKCVCPNMIERWIARPRCQGWPSLETVHEISLLDGHVVPVGFKDSQNMYKEWRICYSLAELHLMQTLNETQLKVYILLKQICRSTLKAVCKDMTSYIMKNVILWMCEVNGLKRFRKELMMDRLFDCIQYLKNCLCENSLPSYMIPERNLLAGRVDTQQKQQLVSLLSDLLTERSRLLLRCDKLRDAMIVMYKTPNMFRRYSEKRDKVETLLLMIGRIRGETVRPKMRLEELDQLTSQNELYCNMHTHVGHLIQFNVAELRAMGKTKEEISHLWHTKLSKILS